MASGMVSDVKVVSPHIFRPATAIKEDVTGRLESTIWIMIAITAVEYPRARSVPVRIPVLMKIDEFVKRSKIDWPVVTQKNTSIY